MQQLFVEQLIWYQKTWILLFCLIAIAVAKYSSSYLADW